MYIHTPVHVEIENMLIAYTVTVHWGMGGGRGVSVGGVSQLRHLNVFELLSSMQGKIT